MMFSKFFNDNFTKMNNKMLTPAGAGLSTISFFLPWVSFSCSGIERNASGYDLASQSSEYWIVLIGAAFILGLYLAFQKSEDKKQVKVGTIAISVISIGVMIYGYVKSEIIGFDSGFGTKIKGSDIGLSVQLGAISTVIGFILAAMGTKYLEETKDKTAGNKPQTNET